MTQPWPTAAQALGGVVMLSRHGAGVSRAVRRAALMSGVTPAVLLAHVATSSAQTADPVVTLDPIQVQAPTFGTSGIVATHSTAGTKSNTPLREVPAAISVVTREELDRRGVQDFNAAVGYTPGIRAVDYPGGQGAADIYIRGYRAINFLGIYQDGVRGGFNNYDSNIETYGLERIDIIKGSVSALYGQGTPGGVVNLLTKRPLFERLNEVQVQGGSFNRVQGAFDLSGPVNDQFAYRLTGLARDADSQVAHTPDRRLYIAPAFTWKPNADTSFTVLANHLWLRRGGSEQSLPISGTLRPNPNGRLSRDLFLGEPDFNKEAIKSTSVGYILDHAFSESWRLHSITRYSTTDTEYQAMGASNGGALTNNRFYKRTPYARRQDSEGVLTDNHIEGKITTGPLQHTIIGGIDFATYVRRDRRWIGATADLDVYNPVYGAPIILPAAPNVRATQNIQQLGVYVQDQIKVGGLIVTLGARQDWVTSRTKNGITNSAVHREDKAFSYRVGVGYVFEAGIVPYASYSTSFNPLPFNRSDGKPFEPSKARQFEAGVKYQPPGINGYVTASVFNITQTNVATADPNNPGFFNQTGETRSRGFELEGKTTLTEGLSVIGSYAYLDAKVTKDTVLKGKRLEKVPRHSASLWLDYAFQSGDFRGLRLGAGVRYVGRTTNATNVDKIPGYALFDASISYEVGNLIHSLEGLKLSVSAANLFDKRYFTSSFYQGTVLEGNRRTVYATLSHRF
ncbi:TonB-dependent siderophore receptor [Reyranella sp. CPCC 100927]|nr:TonB-dependent siderophore receptor [Reyranella sp. CPCC 100927]